MKRRPKWSTVTIALAVIAALAIASPVLGVSKSSVSKSIKKAIKKEVSKQISKATGPTGKNGKNGATVVHIRTGTGTGSASADCNPGETPTGGGAINNAGNALKSSFPNTASDPTLPNGTWTAQAVAGGDSVTVRILCASP